MTAVWHRGRRATAIVSIIFGCLMTVGAKGSSAPPRQPARTNVVFVGDSLAEQATQFLPTMIGTKPLIPHVFGGTAPCGWLDTDLGITASSIVAISFTGNSLTPCMSDGHGGQLQGQAVVDKYRSDVGALITEALDVHAQVLLVGQPAQGANVGGNDVVDGLNAMYIELSNRQGVSFVDAGAAVENPDGTFAAALPCLPDEQECGPSGRNVIHNDDGLHFCPGSPPAGPCAVYSSGAFRFARAIADAINTNGIGQSGVGVTTELIVTGRGGVGAGASAVVLNVASVDAVVGGFVTVWPCGTPRPFASNVNFAAGATLANAVISKVGVDGKICLFTSNPTDLVVDVNGYFPATTSYVSLVPARLLDTRTGPAATTIDEQFEHTGRSGFGSTTELTVTDRGGVGAGASAVVLNVTSVDAVTGGFVTVWPCGTARPFASNVNLTKKTTLANVVISKVGVDGKVCLFTSNPTDLVVDVNGYFPTTTSYLPLVPARLLDTRTGPAATTIDGQFQQTGRSGVGATTELTVTDRGGIGTGASAVVLNVTSVDAAVGGFVTVWPCGTPRPFASNVNLTPGVTLANAVITKVGLDGKVCLFTSNPTDLVVDINGSFPTTTDYVPLVPARLLDTRDGPAMTTTDGQFQYTGG